MDCVPQGRRYTRWMEVVDWTDGSAPGRCSQVDRCPCEGSKSGFCLTFREGSQLPRRRVMRVLPRVHHIRMTGHRRSGRSPCCPKHLARGRHGHAGIDGREQKGNKSKQEQLKQLQSASKHASVLRACKLAASVCNPGVSSYCSVLCYPCISLRARVEAICRFKGLEAKTLVAGCIDGGLDSFRAHPDLAAPSIELHSHAAGLEDASQLTGFECPHLSPFCRSRPPGLWALT